MVVFRGKKHTFPALGPCAARAESSLWRLLAVDTMIPERPRARRLEEISPKRSFHHAGACRSVCYDDNLATRSAKRYHHHSCRLDYAFSFPRQKRVSNFPIRAAMKLSAACILCCVPMLRIPHKQLAIFRLQARFVRLPFSVSKCTKNESRRPQMDEMHLGLVGIVAYNDVRDDPASKLHTRSDQRLL